jgi:hypothetical protein
VFEQALERGLEDIWEDIVLERYFDEEITAVARRKPTPFTVVADLNRSRIQQR